MKKKYLLLSFLMLLTVLSVGQSVFAGMNITEWSVRLHQK